MYIWTSKRKVDFNHCQFSEKNAGCIVLFHEIFLPSQGRIVSYKFSSKCLAFSMSPHSLRISSPFDGESMDILFKFKFNENPSASKTQQK